ELIDMVTNAPTREERPLRHGDPANVPQKLRSLARAVAEETVDVGRFAWRPFAEWSRPDAVIAELPGRPSLIAGLPASKGGQLLARSDGRLFLELVPHAGTWRIPIDPDLERVAALVGLFSGQRSGSSIRR